MLTFVSKPADPAKTPHQPDDEEIPWYIRRKYWETIKFAYRCLERDQKAAAEAIMQANAEREKYEALIAKIRELADCELLRYPPEFDLKG